MTKILIGFGVMAAILASSVLLTASKSVDETVQIDQKYIDRYSNVTFFVNAEVMRNWKPPKEGITAVVYSTSWCEECYRILSLVNKFDDVKLYVVVYENIANTELKGKILPLYTETLPRVIIFDGPNKIHDIQANAAFKIEQSDEEITKAIKNYKI